MSSKSSYGSKYAGVFTTPISGAIGSTYKFTTTTSPSIPSGTEGEIVTSIFPKGVYSVNSYLQAVGNVLIDVSSTITYQNIEIGKSNISLDVGAGVSSYRPVVTAVFECDGLNGLEFLMTCTTDSGANWNLSSGSYFTVTRIA